MIKLFISILLLFSFSPNHLNATEIKYVANDILIQYSVEKNIVGETFFKLDNSQDSEVLYFFNYNCISCMMMHKYINSWSKNMMKKNVLFKKIPVSLNKNWQYSVELHYIISNLGVKEFEDTLYNDIHINNNPILSEAAMYDFLRTKLNYSKLHVLSKINLLDIFNLKNKHLDIVAISNTNSTPSIIINKNNKTYKIKINKDSEPLSLIIALEDILNPKKKTPSIN